MSCNCNKCIQICNPCPQFNYSQQNQSNNGCNYGCNNNWSDNKRCHKCNHHECQCEKKQRCHECGHRNCRCEKKQRCNKCSDRDCKCKKSRCDQCNNHKCRCEKSRCDKCNNVNCNCINAVRSIRVRCGCISASLTKTATPTVVTTAGQNIIYTYTITNTGSAPICYPIQICDDKLGTQHIPGSFILPGQSQSFSRTYTTIPSDFAGTSIVNNAVAFIQVECDKAVCTDQATATVTIGGADLSGVITQGITGITGTTGTVIVNVAIINSASSAIAASGVSLTLPFPAGITSITPISITPPGSIIPSLNSVTISYPTIAIGQTVLAQFSYVANIPGAYTWSGTITSTSFDPNLSNNNLTNTIIL